VGERRSTGKRGRVNRWTDWEQKKSQNQGEKEKGGDRGPCAPNQSVRRGSCPAEKRARGKFPRSSFLKEGSNPKKNKKTIFRKKGGGGKGRHRKQHHFSQQTGGKGEKGDITFRAIFMESEEVAVSEYTRVFMRLVTIS